MKYEEDFTPFYSAFLRLCRTHGLSPTAAAREAGISSGAPTAWKNNGSIPKPEQRKRLCKLFDVTDLELMGYYTMEPVPPERSTRGMTPEEREAHYRGLHLSEQKEKPAGQKAGGLDQETVALAEKIREAAPGVKRLLDSILNEGGKAKSDIQKIKITCPIDGTEQVIYQPGYRIGSIFIPECGNNGCEMCHPCNECTICRLKAVSSSLPDLDIK